MRGSPRVHPAVAGCIGRPDEVNNPQHSLRITEAPRILMLHSRHDPANHFSGAANVHRQTRGTTVLLPYEGARTKAPDTVSTAAVTAHVTQWTTTSRS
ncbi:alpha/beta hydrolase [Streptomyces sp. NPDC002285]